MILVLSQKQDDLENEDAMLADVNAALAKYGYRISSWGPYDKLTRSFAKNVIGRLVDNALEADAKDYEENP